MDRSAAALRRMGCTPQPGSSATAVRLPYKHRSTVAQMQALAYALSGAQPVSSFVKVVERVLAERQQQQGSHGWPVRRWVTDAAVVAPLAGVHIVCLHAAYHSWTVMDRSLHSIHQL